ncbi:MAG TPA: hypothetical protein DEP23_04730 [Ruminococcaceae bacterium]|nr:hypothetical protein [Oscillospiraceae bacterium]
MTPRELSEYIGAKQEVEEAKYKMAARLFDFAAIKIIAGRHFKNPKNISLHDYFPTLFKADGSPAPPTNISPERKQKIATDTWKRFLGM